ncbi:MAG: DegQ family serine endoprotease [Alphaproteobacteria bacterium]|nr:DegQ family serine endoprotease [Alphaproteobacteria bacterium]
MSQHEQTNSRTLRVFLYAMTLSLGAAFTFSALITPHHAQAEPPVVQKPQIAETGFADMVQNLLPAVVNISSTQKVQESDMQLPEMPQFPPGSPFEDFFEEFMGRRRDGGPMPPQTSLGSGFVVDAANGYIITNNHVVQDAESVRVTFHDDETVNAEVIGIDEKTDIAVLKVKTEKKLTEVHFGDSDILRVGDWVVAIGNPFGLGGTVTAGIVSARQRDIQSGPYDDFIQTDASINRGNSGGPMFNLKGEVIGINTAIFSPSGGSVGIGFAIPSALAKPVVEQIIKFGRTRRGWLGVRIQSVTPDIAESLKLKQAQGAMVAEVTKGGPAEAAGLRVGDIILSFNGHPIHQMRELPRLVAETPIGSKGKLKYWREGKEMETTLTVGELEKAEGDGLIAQKDPSGSKDQGTVLEGFGMTVSSINGALREAFNIAPNINGIVVTAVEPGKEAELKGLIEGDVIVEVNQQPVASAAQFKQIVVEAKKANRGSVLLLLNHEGEVRFVALKIQ